jgi:hypothetical protein
MKKLLAFLILVGMVALTIYVLQLLYANTKQGQCQVLAKNVSVYARESQGSTSYSPATYTTSFTVVLQLPDGERITTTSNADWTPAGRTLESARSISNSYQIGKTYTCYYNPAQSTHVWFIPPDFFIQGILTVITIITGIVVLVIIGGWLIALSGQGFSL